MRRDLARGSRGIAVEAGGDAWLAAAASQCPRRWRRVCGDGGRPSTPLLSDVASKPGEVGTGKFRLQQLRLVDISNVVHCVLIGLHELGSRAEQQGRFHFPSVKTVRFLLSD